MLLQQQITEDMKQAMRAKDVAKLGTIRLLKAEIKNFEIDHGVQDDAGVQKIVRKLVKQWQDAKNDYQQGGRADLVQEAEGRIAVLQAYLPQAMTDEALREVVKTIIAQATQKQVGPIIGQVMKATAGQADGAKVAQLVKELLA